MAERDNVNPELLENNNPRLIVSKALLGTVEPAEDATNRHSRAPGQAKSYFEFLELVKKALDDYQDNRVKVPENRKLKMSWERPDIASQTEKVTIKLKSREPGGWGQMTARNDADIRNYRSIIREKVVDPANPDYLKVVMGKFYDNEISFTVWAQTNKEAIERGVWFEEFMEAYTWFFVQSGVPRVIFTKQTEDVVIDNKGKKLFGRELCYFVKTEKLTVVDEKVMEDIAITLKLGA